MRKINTYSKVKLVLLSELFLTLLWLFLPEKYYAEIGITLKIFACITLVIPLWLVISIIRSDFIIPLLKITKASQKITDESDDMLTFNWNNEWKDLANNLANIDKKIAHATHFAMAIGDGDFTKELNTDNSTFTLGNTLVEMRNKLKNVTEEEQKRKWATEGLAKFSQILRDNMHENLNNLAQILLSNLIKYLNINQGGVFIIESDTRDKWIEMLACYAYERKKYMQKRVEWGEGIIGQAILEKQHVHLTKIPKEYASITSGLGEAVPNSLLVMPLIVNDEVFGALELASFQPFEPYQIEFVKEVAISFASTLSTAKTTHTTQALLKESQAATELLKQKEHELVQNEEELRAAQETLNNKLIELQAETNLTKCILDAINKSNAAIEFDMDGHILNANEMFLSVMGYNLRSLLGEGEEIMVPKDEIDSKRYQMLWESLKKGNFNTGEFRRIAKNGREVWVDATYNPILDLNGKPYKILMFANFTTEVKEKENDFKNKIQAINDSFPVVETHKDFTIKSANNLFLEELSFKRKDMKNLQLADILPHDYSLITHDLMEKGVFKGKIKLYNAQKNNLSFYLHAHSVKDILGKPVGYLLIFINLHNLAEPTA